MQVKMGRAPCCDKANVKKGPWSPEEDATLKAYIDKYGTGGNWIALPQKIGIKRCGKSCRLRWLNYLRPNIKHGGFTEEEDNIICSLYISIGSRWSIIAAQLSGRTDNDIKNYWNTRLKKKLLGQRKQSMANRLSASGQDNRKMDNHQNPNVGEETNAYNLDNLSSSALERLQLHMQLQSLQNPFPLCNNNRQEDLILTKLNTLQQRMIQTLNSLNENQTILSPQSVALAQDYQILSNLKTGYDQLIPPVDSTGSEFRDSSLFRGQMDGVGIHNDQIGSGFNQGQLLDDLLVNTKVHAGFLTADQVSGFDYLKETDVSKESNNFAWWGNEMDPNLASSTHSFDESAAAMNFHQSAEMYDQDYGIGYSLQ